MQYGLVGLYIACYGCDLILAKREFEENAPLNEPDPEAWAAKGTWIVPGAEAEDPIDDILFIPTRRNDGSNDGSAGNSQR